jgi:hypothetical protein
LGDIIKKSILGIIFLGMISAVIHAVPSFPGAEGFGAVSKGGRGGKVYIVTTTASIGPGSLRQALQGTEPRTIVFRVSGVINLKPAGTCYVDCWKLLENNSFVTIAGQTSPGGITLTGTSGGNPLYTFVGATDNSCHDIVLRFIKVRPMSQSGIEHGLCLASAWNIMVDHCDFGGGNDEGVDFMYSHDLTVQWSTIANSTPPPSADWGGVLMGQGPGRHITMHHNMVANHRGRGGLNCGWYTSHTLLDNGQVDFRNNIAYNSSGSGYFVYVNSDAPGEQPHMNFVGNYFKAGPATPTDGNFWNQVSIWKVQTYREDCSMKLPALYKAIRYFTGKPPLFLQEYTF